MNKFFKRFILVLFLTSVYTYAEIGLSIPFNTNIKHKYTFDNKKTGIWQEDSISGLGVVWDSNVRDDNLYNWRFTLESNKIKLDNEDTFKTISLTNTLGISLFRNDKIRLFMGPRISIGFEEREESSASTFLFGGAIGLNVHITDSISLGVDFDYTTGTSSIISDNYCIDCEYDEDLSGTSARFYFLFSFGSNDTYANSTI